MDDHGARSLGCLAEAAGRGLRGLDHGQVSDALAMTCTLAEFLLITDRAATGHDWLDRALAAASTNDQLGAVGLYERGMLAFWKGADEDACDLHGRSLHLARRLGDQTTVALALCGLARVALREDLDWARTLCEEALQTVHDLMTQRIEAAGRPSAAGRSGG